MRNRIVAEFGGSATIETSATELPAVLEGKHFKHILEIGTMNGFSAAVLAQYADRVTTIDIVDRPIADKVLCHLKVKDRVWRHVVKSNDEKERLVARSFFDMAFLDGDHTRYGLCFDFAITRRCGSVLVHDYPVAAPPLQGSHVYLMHQYPADEKWLDGSGFLMDCIVPAGAIERHIPFAWWRADGA